MDSEPEDVNPGEQERILTEVQRAKGVLNRVYMPNEHDQTNT